MTAIISESPPDEALTGAAESAAWIEGARGFQAWVAVHAGIRMPKPGTLYIPVLSQGPRAAQVEDFEEVARQWQGTVRRPKGGALIMERRFGPLLVRAVLPPEFPLWLAAEREAIAAERAAIAAERALIEARRAAA